MKKKKLTDQKLKLDKTVVAPLTKKEMYQVRGGVAAIRTTRQSLDIDCTSRETTVYNPGV
jgi:hypothetical protein